MAIDLVRRPIKANQRKWLESLGAAPALVGIVEHIALEERYVDADFRDLFYNHYAGKHRSPARHCVRVHLWNRDKALLGSIVLRENPNRRRAGKACWERFKCDISPQWLRASDPSAYVLSSPKKMHVFDSEERLYRFPSIAQDGEITRCAHAATWSTLNFLAEKFRIYKTRLPTEVHQLSASRAAERSYPSPGLYTSEMSSALLECGVFPVICDAIACGDGSKHQLFDLLDIYLESGFPAIACLERRPEAFFSAPRADRWSNPDLVPIGECHAVVIMGHDLSPAPIMDDAGARPFLSYRHRSKYLAVDDNLFPYSAVELVDRDRIRYRVATGSTEPLYNCISSIIVPLPRRIGLFAERIFSMLPYLNDKQQNNINVSKDFDWDDLAFRPFLMSAGSYRKACLDAYGAGVAPKDPKYVKSLCEMPLPHFVWVIEMVSRDGLRKLCGPAKADGAVAAYGHIVLDASACVGNPQIDALKIAWNVGQFWYLYDEDGNPLATRSVPAADTVRPQYRMMSHNLHSVNEKRFN